MLIQIEVEPNPVGLPMEFIDPDYLRRVSQELLSRLADLRIQQSLFSGWHGSIKTNLQLPTGVEQESAIQVGLSVAGLVSHTVLEDTSTVIFDGRVVPIRS